MEEEEEDLEWKSKLMVWWALKFRLLPSWGEGRVDWDPDLRKLLSVQLDDWI